MLKKCILILLVFMINNTNVNAEAYSILKSDVDYSKTSLNLNITKYDWKIDKLRSTSTTDIYYLKKKNFSTALMIDQRVSEGILSNFFNQEALTTTIPAQLVKKYNIPVVPVYIERIGNLNFKITINKPISFQNDTSIKNITDNLNKILEEMILNKPEQWIWSHNRWK